MIFDCDSQTERRRIFYVRQQSVTCTQLQHTHTHRRAGNTPVDWRQLKVAGRAACKQSREQNGFQVVAEKLEESFGKRGAENSMKELLSWFLCRCLFCRIVVLESRNNSDVLKVWQHERPAPMFTAAVNT